MIKLVDKIEDANCITHGGTMHADEVFATAFLELYLKDIRLKRMATIDMKTIPNTIIVYDIGGGEFDHHQKPNKVRDNDIPYASFGLLWQKYGMLYLKQENIEHEDEVFQEFDKNLIEGIDAIDNGVFPKIESSYKVQTISDIIKSFNPSFGSKEVEDEQFKKAVFIAKEIIVENLYHINGKILARKMITDKLKATTNQILILDTYMPYEETLLKSKLGDQILFAIFPSNRGGYIIKTLPKSLTDKTTRLDFPEEWTGLTNEQLEQVSGIVGATFCYNNSFIVGCKTKQSAIKLATIAINKANKDV